MGLQRAGAVGGKVRRQSCLASAACPDPPPPHPTPLPAFRPPLRLLQFQQKLIHEMERYQELADSKEALAARWGEVKGQRRALCMLLGAELSRGWLPEIGGFCSC